MKFYGCKSGKNVLAFLDGVQAPGGMNEITANTTDAAQEKHVPVVEVAGNTVTVKVGSVSHPMTEEHLISWVYLETKQGGQLKYLKAGQEPKAVFELADGDAAVAAYEYCNLHGLWKASV